jgi:hypothetical protein
MLPTQSAGVSGKEKEIELFQYGGKFQRKRMFITTMRAMQHHYI